MKKNKAFNNLKNFCPNLSMSEVVIGREISCSGTCSFNEKKVAVFVESMPEEFEDTLELVIMVFKNPDSFIKKAKEAIANDFLDVYNNDWVSEDESISKDKFIKNLSISSIGAFFGSVIGLDFQEGGMFQGHTLSANSLDRGETFTEIEM